MNERKVDITPQMAKDFLAKNIDRNRHLRPTKVNTYADDMKNDRWIDIGDAIRFDTNGNQHRLHAIIKSGVTLCIKVIYNVPIKGIAVVDTGLTRTFADTLSFEGTPQALRIGPLVRWTLMWEKGYPINASFEFQPSKSLLIERFHETPEEFITAHKRNDDLRRMRLINTTAGGVAYYKFATLDQTDADNFFDNLVSGANLPERSPILVLRNKLLRRKEDRITPPESLALFVRAWNNYRRDNPVLVLYSNGVDKKKLNNFNFPVIKR